MPAKHTQRQRKRFQRLACGMLADLGAEHAGERSGRPMFVLHSRAGPLWLTVLDEWIAGRFEDPACGHRFTDCNPYSGKWNFHEWQSVSGEPEAALAAIRNRIEAFLTLAKLRLSAEDWWCALCNVIDAQHARDPMRARERS